MLFSLFDECLGVVGIVGLWVECNAYAALECPTLRQHVTALALKCCFAELFNDYVLHINSSVFQCKCIITPFGKMVKKKGVVFLQHPKALRCTGRSN